MIGAEDTALVLLAAGRSRRFGDADKLALPFLGQPLAMHVVTALEAVPFRARIAVVSGTGLDFAARGFEVVENCHADAGQAQSLALCVDVAQRLDAAAVIVALADMPRVTAAQVFRLLDAAGGPDAVIASSDGECPMPPALFGRDHFAALMALTGDVGARTLIARGQHIVTTPAELIDIDTPEDYARLTG